nr:hypothetical protein Iba_chr12cCG24600 [Ipomoea batatas]
MSRILTKGEGKIFKVGVMFDGPRAFVGLDILILGYCLDVLRVVNWACFEERSCTLLSDKSMRFGMQSEDLERESLTGVTAFGRCIAKVELKNKQSEGLDLWNPVPRNCFLAVSQKQGYNAWMESRRVRMPDGSTSDAVEDFTVDEVFHRSIEVGSSMISESPQFQRLSNCTSRSLALRSRPWGVNPAD